jgi:hypothetical protein
LRLAMLKWSNLWCKSFIWWLCHICTFFLNINVDKLQVFFPSVLFPSQLHGHCSPYNHPCQNPLSSLLKWVY